MFCPYCGKELEEGQKCDCQRANSEPMKLPDTSALMGNVKKMLGSFFQSPIIALKSHYESDAGMEGMLFGGVYAIATLLFVLLGTVRTVEFGTAFKFAFFALLLSAFAKAAYAGVLFLIQKKYNGDFKKIFGLVCYATIPQTIFITLIGFFGLFKLIKLPIILFVFYVIFALIMGTLVAETVLASRKNIVVWVYAFFAFVIVLICYLVIKKTAVDFMEAYITGALEDAFTKSFGNFY